MSLLPLIFNDEYYLSRPSRILNQHFGMGLNFDDLVAPMNIKYPTGYYRPWQTLASRDDSGSTIKSTNEQFEINLDVQQFKPEEVSVKFIGDNTLMIEGKHEEKPDQHGSIYRHFVRKYRVPNGYDINGIVSKLSSDGVLSITTPRITKGEGDHRIIPVQHTGVPSKAVENKQEEQEKEN